MKRLLLLTFIGSMLFAFNARACLDPTITIDVHTNYDTLMIGNCSYANKLEIRLSNLRMMNESPNKICACALSSFADLFTNLNYVAFVDSATNDPYDGFAEFNSGQQYDGAWDNSQPTFNDWSGFIADVINNGLQASDPLEMVIRATAPAGTVIAIDSACTQDALLSERLDDSNLGTDAWDPIAGDLDESHQGVRPMTNATLNQVTETYFTSLDNDILNNYPTDTNSCSAAFSYEVDELVLEVTDLSNMNANQYVVIDWGDGEENSIMSNQSMEHTYAEKGVYTVCVKNINNGSEVCDACESVMVGPLGIGTVSSSLELSVYPNPAKNVLHVTFDGKMIKDQNLQLVNMLGKSVASSEVMTDGRIDVSMVPNGVYFVQATLKGERHVSSSVVINR